MMIPNEIDEGEYGPAMLALSPMMRRFVLALIENPASPQWRAAEAAGYSPNSNGALRVCAHRLTHDERVLAAISEESGKRLRAASLLASDFLVKMVMDEDVPKKERAKVAVALLDRGGFGAAQTINVNKTVTRKVDASEAMARIAEFREKFPLQFARMIGAAPAVIEGDVAE